MTTPPDHNPERLGATGPTEGSDHDAPPPHVKVPATPIRPVKDDWGPPWVGARNKRMRMDYTLCFAALAAATPATIFFGWRTLVGVVLASLASITTHIVATWIIRSVKPAYQPDSSIHAVTLGALAGLSLPAGINVVPLISLGTLVGLLNHLIGRTRRVRVHPVAVALLVAAAVNYTHSDRFNLPNHPNAVLTPDRIVVGDTRNATQLDLSTPWWRCRVGSGHDAVLRPSPHDVLIDEQHAALHDRWRLAQLLSSGRLRPMTEVILGVAPGPVGATSPALVIMIGLYMMHRRISTSTIALGGTTAATLTLLAMPITHQGEWMVVAQRLLDAGPLITATYLGYMLLATPLTWVVMVLAPQTAPMSVTGRFVYGAGIAAGAITTQWITASPMAAYLSLTVAGLLTPWLDKLRRCPFQS